MNCIGVCPTGALMFKSEYDMRRAGTWDESRQTQTDTICPYCGVGCNLTVHEQDGEIVRVTSPNDHSVTHGNLCIKGRFGWQFIQINDQSPVSYLARGWSESTVRPGKRIDVRPDAPQVERLATVHVRGEP